MNNKLKSFSIDLHFNEGKLIEIEKKFASGEISKEEFRELFFELYSS